MIYQLDKSQYNKLKPLSNYYNIEIPAIISGFNYGKVFVDSKTEPRTRDSLDQRWKFFYW